MPTVRTRTLQHPPVSLMAEAPFPGQDTVQHVLLSMALTPPQLLSPYDEPAGWVVALVLRVFTHMSMEMLRLWARPPDPKAGLKNCLLLVPSQAQITPLAPETNFVETPPEK